MFGILKDLYELPDGKGQYSFGKSMQPEYMEVERQVRIHQDIGPHRISSDQEKIETAIGKLQHIFYDRFYNPGQDLTPHCDRPACEISVTLHVSTNIEGEGKDWPIWIKTPDVYRDKSKTEILTPGEDRSVVLQPGDGMIYKGCERPHWREPLPIQYKKNWYRKNVEIEGLYYHQIFFHYNVTRWNKITFAFDSYQGQACPKYKKRRVIMSHDRTQLLSH